MVTAALIVPFAGGVTEDGAIMQVDFLGSPEQVSPTAELKPPVELTLTLNMPEEPFLIVRTPDCDVVKPKPGCTTVTVPVKAMVCGLLASPSTRTRLAVSVAATEGVYTTLMVQPASGTEIPQLVLFTAKSALFPVAEVNVTVALVNGTAAPVPFVMVTICAAVAVPTALELKVSEVGATWNSDGAVPVRATVCGLDESPSTIDTVAVSDVVEAVNTTPSAQDMPAGMELPQEVLVTTKSVAAAAGLGLVMVALVKGIAVLVLFVNVIDCEAVATPCAVAVKVNVEVETANVGTRLSDAMKASEAPFRAVCAAVDGKTGRSAENVWPVTNTVGTGPKAIPKIWSGLPPACPDPPK